MTLGTGILCIKHSASVVFTELLLLLQGGGCKVQLTVHSEPSSVLNIGWGCKARSRLLRAAESVGSGSGSGTGAQHPSDPDPALPVRCDAVGTE